MMIALITYRKEKVTDVLFHSIPGVKTKSTRGSKKEEYKKRSELNTENQDFDGF